MSPSQLMNDEIRRACALRELGGACNICKHHVVDTAGAFRCRMKNLKVVEKTGICYLFEDKYVATVFKGTYAEDE